MPKIIVDGISYEVDASNNLLEALLTLKKDLPYFCWHPSLGSIGSCRQCAVIQYRDADDDTGRIIMACMTPVADGAIFSTDTANAKAFRQDVIENLMLNHPHDCPVCEEGGECHLQDMTVMTGHRNRKFRGLKNTFKNQDLGPFINHEMNRCITCYRCVRYYQDYAGGHDLAAFGSRGNTFFGRHEDGPLENEFSGNLVEVCPTGVFTDRTLSEHYTRKWDLQSAPSICVGCAVGCNTYASERYGQLRRIHNRYNSELNGYFLCDRGRFGGGFVNSDARIPQAGLRNTDGKYEAIAAEKALEHVAGLMAANETVVGIGSPRASLESNHLLRELVGESNFYSGASATDQLLTRAIIDILRGGVATPSLAEVEQADAVLVLGEDVTNTAPRLALSIRQAARTRANELATEAQIPLWQDAAVRKLAQSELSPIVLLTTYSDRLEDVSAVQHQAAPDALARLGFAIANKIDSDYPAPDGLSADEQALVDSVASILQSSKRPLIVSGSGAQSREVLEAAANVASAVGRTNEEARIALSMPECNSMGLGLLNYASDQTIEDLLAGEDKIATVIVLENDLYRRSGKSAVDALLARVDHLVVLDALDSPTVSASEVVLPAASFAETDSTLVNNEGRAQRSYSVFHAAGDVQGSWQWLLQIGKALEQDQFADLNNFDDVNRHCAQSNELLSGVAQIAPGSDTRTSGMKVARMTHRSSGRTAMVANVSLHEPQQPADSNSALAYTMEGISGPQAGSLAAYAWSPGWNSNQAVHKFQEEAGGPLAGGNAGTRLIDALGDSASVAQEFAAAPSPRENASGQVALIPRYHIFGSDELSARVDAIAARAPVSYIAINPASADSLAVTSMDGVNVALGDATLQLEVVVDSSVPDGCALFPAGLADVVELSHQKLASLSKASDWSPRKNPNDNLIAKQ